MQVSLASLRDPENGILEEALFRWKCVCAHNWRDRHRRAEVYLASERASASQNPELGAHRTIVMVSVRYHTKLITWRDVIGRKELNNSPACLPSCRLPFLVLGEHTFSLFFSPTHTKSLFFDQLILFGSANSALVCFRSGDCRRITRASRRTLK